MLNRVNTPAASSVETSRAFFDTTHWGVVLSAQDDGGSVPSEALGELCQKYWPPLYAFLRRRGYSPADAEDLVQGFFERFIERAYLRDVSPEKGRFRSFLLKSLQHHAANARRGEHAQRRGGRRPHIALDEPEAMERCEAALSAEPPLDAIFDQVWALTVMDHARRRLRSEYEVSGRGPLFEALRVWLASEAAPGAYETAAPQLGMTPGAVAAGVFRMRQRFRRLVRDEVARTVQAPGEIEAEMRYLFRVLTEA